MCLITDGEPGREVGETVGGPAGYEARWCFEVVEPPVEDLGRRSGHVHIDVTASAKCPNHARQEYATGQFVATEDRDVTADVTPHIFEFSESLPWGIEALGLQGCQHRPLPGILLLREVRRKIVRTKVEHVMKFPGAGGRLGDGEFARAGSCCEKMPGKSLGGPLVVVIGVLVENPTDEGRRKDHVQIGGDAAHELATTPQSLRKLLFEPLADKGIGHHHGP
jgi:hypothetical protein